MGQRFDLEKKGNLIELASLKTGVLFELVTEIICDEFLFVISYKICSLVNVEFSVSIKPKPVLLEVCDTGQLKGKKVHDIYTKVYNVREPNQPPVVPAKKQNGDTSNVASNVPPTHKRMFS